MVAQVVAAWTGIPVGKMVQDTVKALLNIENNLRQRIKGQDYAIHHIAKELRSARAGLKPANTPMGVFLLVGPSGVGKTETGLTLADQLYGGERMMVTINMSEFQEKHTVSRLIGSPPGYVGYGEGGMLTEAVRQRPVHRRAARRDREGRSGRAEPVLPGVRQGHALRRRGAPRRLQEHGHHHDEQPRHRQDHQHDPGGLGGRQGRPTWTRSWPPSSRRWSRTSSRPCSRA